MVDALECAVMPYAWGSHTALAQLTSRPSPSPGPEAELWMGAHHAAPSYVARENFENGVLSPLLARQSLTRVIAENPACELGEASVHAFGPHLPFLLKVLAAAEPLSLQAHPNAERAKAGFEDENRRGIPLDSPLRNYRDDSHKPELLCALEPVDALCGFRRIDETLRLFDTLNVAALDPWLAPLRAEPNRNGLAHVFGSLMRLEAHEAANLVDATLEACQKRSASASSPTSPFFREFAWAERLGSFYPGDIGVVSALFLNLIRLEVGQAIYLAAGNLHAYLGGVGVEIMASSDNVLRGGLTKKHVDVVELLRTLDFTDGPVRPVIPRHVDACEEVWETPATEFRLSALTLSPGGTVTRDVSGPEIVLCTQGQATVTPAHGASSVTLKQGQSAFIPASTERYALNTAEKNEPREEHGARVFRATVNLT